MNNIIEHCHFLLNNCQQAKDSKAYLDSRLSQDTQDVFQFGYIPNSQNLTILTDVIDEGVLKQENLLYSKSIEDAHSCRSVKSCYFEEYPLIMPFHNVYGQVAGIVGRTLLSEKGRTEKQIAKYKNTRESSIFKKGNLLFGLFQNKSNILEKNCVYIVEGQFDMIKAYEIGFRNVVALGNNNMTQAQFALIMRYTTNIMLLLDNDSAGLKGRERIHSKFGKFANITDYYVSEEYKDLDEYITKSKISDVGQLCFS